MKKFAYITLFTLSFVLSTSIGCGSGETKVIEAPAEVSEEQPAIEGMSDEEYDAAMDAEMNE